MAKGKKTTIKEIKKLSDDTIMINGNTYVIIQDSDDIESAKTMKISSHGNRLLRFEDANKIAKIDVKRPLRVSKYTINDDARAAKFKRGYDRKLLEDDDKMEVIAKANCHTNARAIVASYAEKTGENYDKRVGVNTFYISEDD